jgi:hypothetical protein
VAGPRTYGNTLQLLLDRSRSTWPLYSSHLPINLRRSGRRWTQREFNEARPRLAGLRRPSREEAVFRLVARIEAEFPRPRFADVHASLLAIHGGQVHSLTQQDDPEIPDARILAISCEKGGSSVLADLYLVAGDAPRPERFAFGTVSSAALTTCRTPTDRAAGTRPFTRSAARPSTKTACPRFIDRVLRRRRFAGPSGRSQGLRAAARTRRRDADQPRRFTRAFAGRSNASGPFHWPPSETAAAGGRFTRAASRLQADARRRS